MPRLTAVNPLADVAGGETGLLRLLPRLAQRGWAVRLTVPTRGRLEEAARSLGVTVRRLPLGPPERRTAASYAGGALAPLVLAGSDVVFLNGLSTQRVLPALSALRRPAVLRVNNPLTAPPPAWSRDGFWRGVPAVVADSEHVARECREAGAPPERVHAVFPPAWGGAEPPGQLAPPPSAQRVAFAGQLEPRKGLAELIEAACLFLTRRPQASLTVLGEAPRGEEAYARGLRARAASSELAGRICFEGWVEDAAAKLAAFDVVVVPSLAEPFGTVAAEAAAAGRPVVASAVGGLCEVVIDGETGLLVPPGEPRALADAVGALLDDHDRLRALGARGLERASRFAPDTYADRVNGLLAEAVG